MRTLKTLADVVDWRMCLGCGACAYICTKGQVTLVDRVNEGIRPEFNDASCADCSAECLSVCPSVEIDLRANAKREGIIKEVHSDFGPILEIWEGHACDPEIRFKGSSGGALTAISLFCIEREGMAGVLQTGQSPTDAALNSTRLSTTREALMTCVGSRYAPASVCDGLKMVEDASSPCVVVGQPSEISAVRKAELIRPELKKKVGLTLSFFCAGSPSTEGTLELMKKYQVVPDSVKYTRYRGFGWPGFFSTQTADASSPTEHLAYRDAWAFLQKFRPYATHLFPDGSGEDADISCGDPWYRKVEPGEHGSSLIVVRTQTGREILSRAVAAGYLTVKPATPEQLNKSQGYLIKKRGAVWGRLLAFRLLLVPTPRYRGYALFKNWWDLSFGDKQRSVLGTIVRILKRGYHRRAPRS